MKKVITYGSYDLLHHGHIRLLERAKALGDFLIVGVTSENYDKNRGKLNVSQSLIERIDAVRDTGLADMIIIEEYEGQKIDDILKYKANVFAIGSDWKGKFDYLGEYCEVVYLERTKGISSTQVRGEKHGIINLGIIGTGRIANRFVPESKFVSGVNVNSVYNPTISLAQSFAETHELNFFTNNLQEFLKRVDVVYIASPHKSHADYIKTCFNHTKHVLCEKPMVLSAKEAADLYEIADKKNLVLMEGLKTTYAPAFNQLIALVKSGVIGQIKDIQASFTKLTSGPTRELNTSEAGGSVTELASYPLLPIIRILGNDYDDIRFYSFFKNGVDVFTRGIIHYRSAVASFKVGLGVKTEGDLVISGTKGYAYVPAPWWKTEYFELRFEDLNMTKKHFSRFEGDGLRYEINEFLSLIKNPEKSLHSKLIGKESVEIIKIIETFLNYTNVHYIH